MLPGIPAEYLETKLEKIRRSVEEAVIPGYAHLRPSISIGGVMQTITDPIERAVRQADRMMYQAKNRKNTVAVAGPDRENVKNGTQEEAEKLVDRMFSFETPGTYTVIATLTWKDENGEYHHKDFIVTRTVGEDEGPSEEEIRHDMEMKRQAEAIGGVYGSPYWIKQLYLGYHSYNLRLLIDGQPVTMRERLNWNADKSKGISLRVNTVAPEKLTMRFDEKVLEVFERTNITTVTLLDKNGAAVMQYNVSDLRAAYDQYGLNDADQLVVGGVDDDVMKIGADGQLVPVE